MPSPEVEYAVVPKRTLLLLLNKKEDKSMPAPELEVPVELIIWLSVDHWDRQMPMPEMEVPFELEIVLLELEAM